MLGSPSPAGPSSGVGPLKAAVTARTPRWPWAVALASGIVGALAVGLQPRPDAPTLLVLGVDSSGWSFVAAVVALATASAAALAVPFTLVSKRRSSGALLVRVAAAVAVAAFWTVAALPLLILGVTSFLAEYRTVGSVTGRDVVLRYEPGFQDAGTVDAGYRNGVGVDFAARGDTILGPAPEELDSWRFRIEQASEGLRIRYRTRGDASGSGVLVLDPPPPAESDDGAGRPGKRLIAGGEGSRHTGAALR